MSSKELDPRDVRDQTFTTLKRLDPAERVATILSGTAPLIRDLIERADDCGATKVEGDIIEALHRLESEAVGIERLLPQAQRRVADTEEHNRKAAERQAQAERERAEAERREREAAADYAQRLAAVEALAERNGMRIVTDPFDANALRLEALTTDHAALPSRYAEPERWSKVDAVRGPDGQRGYTMVHWSGPLRYIEQLAAAVTR